MIVRNKIETDLVREESLDSRFEHTEFDMPVEIKTKTAQEFHGPRIWTSQRGEHTRITFGIQKEYIEN